MSSRKDEIDSIVEFKGDPIRRTWYNERWYFSVVDVVSALSGSVNPRDYWYRLKKREKETSGIELSTPQTDGNRWEILPDRFLRH